MKNPFTDLYYLFFPPMCPACGDPMPEGGRFVCTQCHWDIPLTDYWKRRDNPVMERLSAHTPIEGACSFYFYVDGSPFRGIVHKFKYFGGWALARRMGLWFGAELAGAEAFRSVDVIVPVPLHFRKQLKRGYNQSDYLAEGIGRAMGVPVDVRSVKRRKHNTSQTDKNRSERWNNVEGIFSVRRPEKLKGKHILLVDDVLTTGATILSCAQAILDAVPNCTVSIATLAVAKPDLGI